MRFIPLHTILAAVLLSALAPLASAQQNSGSAPHIGYVYPAGGRQGTTFELAIGGQFLTGASEVRMTGGAVRATVLKLEKPLTGGQAAALRDKLKALMEKKFASFGGFGKGAKSNPAAPFTEEDQKTIEEIRKKLLTFKKNPTSPSIAETATLQVTIDAGASVGLRELRLVTPAGLSNPMIFCVGQLTEFAEPASKPITSDSPTPITLPAVVNGQIMPGGVNRYSFTAHRGDHLVFSVAARDLVPYIADAVPGWFQATLGIYDSNGNELAYADHWRFRPDPVLYCQIPGDGEYTMEIKDSLYRGREDFVYRVTAGELPFVTSIFPLGGKMGKPAVVELQGWNLPETRVKPVMDAVGPSPFYVHRGILDSNIVPFAVDALPECDERKPNGSQALAQPIALPMIINGRIEHPGEWGVFRFDGRAGEEVVAEVYARRLNSPLDSILKLTDAEGKQLAVNDDHDDLAAGLLTHQADSWLRLALPATGTYYLHIGDAQHKGGPEYAYRLRVSHPRPDFELRVTPSSVNVRAGGTAAITVHAIRRDGFSGPIALDLSHVPTGCVLVGTRIAAGQDLVQATITVPEMSATEPFNIELQGRAIIDGHLVSHKAIPAEDMMQAFFYRHLVPAHEWLLDVSELRRARAEIKVVSSMPVRIPAGGKGRIVAYVSKSAFLGPVEFELAEAPDGLTLTLGASSGDQVEIVLTADAAKLKPGLKGNLIINASAQRVPLFASAKTNKPKTARQRIPLGTLPAVPFEVVSR